MAEGCQVHAGILKKDGTLTFKAKKKFIKAIKDELTYGTDNLPQPPLFPCGASVQPNEFAYLLDLENEKKFPEFHKNIVGTYERIAQSLNSPSDFKILPICCPISLGAKLGVKIKIPNFPAGFIPFMIPNPPLLALKMKIMPPPKLVAQFPDIPSIPPPIPKFDIPPNIKIPDFKTYFDFTYAFEVGIPKFILSIVAKMPQLALKLPALPELFSDLCKAAFDSKMFGDIQPGSTTETVAVKVLTTKVVEMSFINAVGTTIGSSGGGVTGGIGKVLGYDPDDESEEEPLTTRDQIVQYALEFDGLSYGAGGDKRDLYTQKLLYREYPEPDDPPGPHSDLRARGKAASEHEISEASTCGMVARACLFAGGASYVLDTRVDTSIQDPGQYAHAELYHDFFQDRYPVGLAIAGIYAAARAKHALIDIIPGDLPPLQRGDIILVEVRGDPEKDHAIVLVEDYVPGSLQMTTIEGGQNDVYNGGKPTSAHKRSYINAPTVQNANDVSMFVDLNNEVIIGGRNIKALIDSEKVCTDQTGSDMRHSNGGIDPSLGSDGPGFGFQVVDPPPPPPPKDEG